MEVRRYRNQDQIISVDHCDCEIVRTSQSAAIEAVRYFTSNLVFGMDNEMRCWTLVDKVFPLVYNFYWKYDRKRYHLLFRPDANIVKSIAKAKSLGMLGNLNESADELVASINSYFNQGVAHEKADSYLVFIAIVRFYYTLVKLGLSTKHLHDSFEELLDLLAY